MECNNQYPLQEPEQRQNKNITPFKYEPFDRYDLQEEENYDTTTSRPHPEENYERAENYEHAHRAHLAQQKQVSEDALIRFGTAN